MKGIKAFKDTGELKIKPLTLFVGENNSGKSSILRFLSVLSQTYQENIKTPLLFSGKLIDYGNYESVSYNNEDGEISFEVELAKIMLSGNFLSQYLNPKDLKEKLDNSSVLNIVLEKEKRRIRVKELTVKILDNKILLNLKKVEEGSFYEFYSEIFSCINGLKKNLNFNRFIPSLNNNLFLFGYEYDDAIIKLIRPKFSDKEREELKKSRRNNFIFLGDKIMEEKVEKYKDEEKDYKEIEVILSNLQNFFDKVQAYFDGYSRESVYIGPFRDSPKRLYTESENIYETVGVSGENTCFILKHIFENQKNSLEKISLWLEKSLGTQIRIKEIKEANSFKVITRNKNGRESNIIDSGYGISQILPILSEIYSDDDRLEYRRQRRYNSTKLLMIEQPELHLHPRAQANLAPLFAESVSTDKRKRFLIETHSEHLIRKLQVLIADKNNPFTKEDIVIYYVYKEKEMGEGAIIKEMELNEVGQFKEEWPEGFFNKADQLVDELILNIYGDN